MKPFKRIFLIEDDSISVFLVKKTIEASNFLTDIKVFNDGLEAIEYFEEIVGHADLFPDIIFLDLSMPVMDGWAFLEEYMQMQPRLGKDIALYVTTSSISPHDIERAKSIRVVSDFLIKPLVTYKVVELLSKLN
ncbi:MAG: response regulator [Flavobacteriaceae bacterium]|nr:response regulator [Flavobacteriaceae bacterium]